MGEQQHVAFIGYPGFGHLKPTLQIVEELIRRGHRVSYVVSDHFADAVAATGATPVLYHSRIPDEAGVESEIDDDRMALGLINEAWHPMSVAVPYFDNDPPHLVLHDSIAQETAKLLSMRFDIPRVRMFTTFATSERAVLEANPGLDLSHFTSANLFGPKFLELYAHIDSKLSDLGAPNILTVSFQSPDAALNLVFLPKTFQPFADQFDDTYHWVGPSLWERDAEQSWMQSRPDAPLVVVSLGTSPSNHRLEFLRTCVQASAGQPWETVICLGNTHDPAELGVLPANVSVHQWLSPTSVLPRAAAFVTHAGMGSLMESFACGVPVLLAPDMKEQWVNAFFAVQSGLGYALTEALTEAPPEGAGHSGSSALSGMPSLLMRDQVSVDRLAELIDELIVDRQVHDSAALLAQEIEGCGGPSSSADLIEACLLKGARLP
jgi:MGT family glycosyltransferase